MFCAQCGSPNPDGAKFCGKCGQDQSGDSAPPAAGAGPTASVPPVQPASALAKPLAGLVNHPATSGKAVASLICGFLFFAFPVPIAAIILGHLSLSDIRKSAGRLTGEGIAIGGLVLGYLGVLMIPIMLIVAVIAIPNLLRARMAENQASAVGSLRQIDLASVAYSDRYRNGFPPAIEALTGIGEQNCDHAGLIDEELASGTRRGYVFTYTPMAGTDPKAAPKAPASGCSVAGAGGFAVTADPVTRGTTGQTSYYVDETGVIRYDTNGEATADSPELK